MRKRIVNKVFTVVLLLIICAIAMIGCQKKPTGEEKKPSTKVQLLSFDSYDEIAGTKIALENQFGRIEINKDKAYITEGTGSMKVQPQGNYAKPSLSPYVQFDCVESTMATNDFSNFRKVSFDIYNNTDEELQVILTLRASGVSGSMNFPSNTYTLKPNEWTTCTYQIEGNMPDGYAYLKEMRYIQLTFPESKVDKNDTPNEFYIDNLVAESYEEPLNVTDKGYDFYEGITFEDSKEQCLVVGYSDANNKVDFQRVNYAEEGMEVPEELGEWGMKGKATGTCWPTFMFNYGEVVPAGTVLNFWVYVQVDDPVEAGGNLVMESGAGKMYVTNKNFNNWFEVTIVLSADAESSSVMFNFDNNWGDTAGISFFGEKEVNVWVDNVSLLSDGWEEPEEIVEKDGVVTIYNPTGDTTRLYKVEKSAKQGQVISFDIDFNSTEKVGIWVLAEGKWNEWDGETLTKFNEFTAGYYEPWTGKKTIACIADRDIEFFSICLAYSGADISSRVCTISNIQVGDKVPEVTVKDGVVTIKNELIGDTTRQYDVKIPAKEGQIISFDIDFNAKDKVGIWVLAEGKWNEWSGETLTKFNEFTAGYYEPWSGKKTIACIADRDIEYFSIVVSYSGANLRERICTISNIQVGDKVPEVTEKDGVITIKNEIIGDTTRQYDVRKPAKKDQIISFDIDFNTEDKVGIWVLAEGKWNQWSGETLTEFNEYTAGYYEPWSGKKTITCVVDRDIEYFSIVVQYSGQNLKERVCTISNLQVKEKDPEIVEKDGVVTIINPLGDSTRIYEVQQAVKGGEVISFDIDFNSTDKVGIWVLANGKWNKWENNALTENNEFIARYYEPWEGVKTIQCTASKDIDYFSIVVQYHGSDFKSKVCTISNIEVLSTDPFELLTFEEAKHMMNVKGYSEENNRCTLSRVAYADVDIAKKDDSFGDYVLRGEATGAPWPTIEVNLGKTYDKKVTVTFDVYVEVEATKIKNNQFIYEVGGNWARSDLKFNQWETVSYTLPAGASSVRCVANFDMTGALQSGATPYIYIDNIQVKEVSE